MSATKGLWDRDWELLFRCSEILWARLGEHPSILPLRREFAELIEGRLCPCSPYEASRFSYDIEPIVDATASCWSALFKQWFCKRRTFVFPDGFSVLFLLRILWANEVILFRGHYDARWKLSSTLSRAQSRGSSHTELAGKQAERFLDRLQLTDTIKGCYLSGIPAEHKVAILQHYGFPTPLMDFTYSADVALYFAEGGNSYKPESASQPECGAIYAIPPFLLPPHAHLLTLPPAVMRPSLQRGVFIADISGDELEPLETLKFVFKHQRSPIWNGLGSIHYGAPVDLTRYLLPAADEIEALAREIRHIEDGVSAGFTGD